MKRIITVLLIIFTLTLFGCTPYTSSYRAVGYVHSNTHKHVVMSFYEFTGTQAFDLNAKDGECIKYTAKLETGKADVYYDCGEGKVLLFTVNGGDEFSGQSDALRKGKAYLIVETDGKCSNGAFEYTVE